MKAARAAGAIINRAALDLDLLKNIAARTNAEFFTATDPESLRSIFAIALPNA